jgi:hypothetical protein
LVPEDVGAPGWSIGFPKDGDIGFPKDGDIGFPKDGDIGFPKDGDIGSGPLAVIAGAAAATVTDIKKNITIKRHIVVFVLSNLCFFVLILSFFWSILYIL